MSHANWSNVKLLLKKNQMNFLILGTFQGVLKLGILCIDRGRHSIVYNYCTCKAMDSKNSKALLECKNGSLINLPAYMLFASVDKY